MQTKFTGAAARVDDQIKHSEAREYRILGAVGATLLSLAILGGLAALEIGTFGMATPLVVATAVVVVGTSAGIGSAAANVAADEGAKVPGPIEGPIKTGIPSILIGPEKKPAAHLGSYASCDRHKHGGASTMQYATDVAEDVVGGLIKDAASIVTSGLYQGGRFNPAADWNQGIKDAHDEHDNLEQIVQGSKSVLIGSGSFHAARVGDQGTCGFTVGEGCKSVMIGGETFTEGEIGDGDDPDKNVTDLIGEYGCYAALAGGFVLALPAGIVAASLGLFVDYCIGQFQGEIVNAVFKDQETRDKVNLALAALPIFHALHGAGRGAGHGGGETEPVGSSGRGPENGGTTRSIPSEHTAETPTDAQPKQAGNGENTPQTAPIENPVNQIGEQPGGQDGTAPPDQAGGGKPADDAGTSGSAETPKPASEEAVPDASTEKPATDEKPSDEETDADTDQAAKDKAFQERSAERTQAVREGVSNKVRKSDPNYAASEFTPAPGSEMVEGGGQYDPSISGEAAPRYGPIDPATGMRTNPTEPGTGALKDLTHPINEPGQHKFSRANDSEIKQMEAFQRDLDANPSMRGTQDIYSDWRDPCTSCKSAAEQFNNNNIGRARVRIHSPNGDVFEKGGGSLDLPPDGEGGSAPPSGEPEGSGQGDPLTQIGSRKGGAPGESSAEQAEGNASAEKASGEAADDGNPTVQSGDSPGGKTGAAGSDAEAAAPGGKSETPPPAETDASADRLDYSRNFERDLENFEPGATLHEGPLVQDMTLVQYHRADTALGDGRSASWWTTTDSANNLSTVDAMREALALPPDWGPRDAVSVARIPAGTDVTYYEGTAVEQVSKQTGEVYKGGGLQYRFKNFDPAWVTETRPLP